MATANCQLCGARVFRVGRKPPRHCHALNAAPENECWQTSSNELQRLCSASLLVKPRHIPGNVRRIDLLRELGNVSASGESSIIEWLRTREAEECRALVKCVHPAMSGKLSLWVESVHGIAEADALLSVHIPAGLPESLLEGLRRYQAIATSRYRRLIEKGHSRAPDYVRRRMVLPIRLARYLVEQGVTRWDAVRKRDLVAFAESVNGRYQAGYIAFLRFLNDANPFKEMRGRPTSKRKGVRPRITPPSVLAPAEVDELLERVRSEHGDAAFLALWLVGKMGMTAEAAFKLSLAQFELSEAGRLVFRPARVWIAVPKPLTQPWLQLLKQVMPGWHKLPMEQRSRLAPIRIMLGSAEDFVRRTIPAKSKILRSSAIYAAMMSGKLDRVTIHQSMGVSMPTILKMETLLSVDMHRKLDPDIVAARNARIRGDRND